MKSILTTDDHFTSDNFSAMFKIYEELVIPTALDNGITTIINLGDFTDKRVGLDALLQFRLWNEFIPLIVENNMHMIFLVGNHQSYYKDRTDIHTLEMFKHLPEIYQDHITIIDEPMDMKLENKHLVTLIPWLVTHNSLPIKPGSSLVLGHFEAKGGLVTNSYASNHGLDANELKKYTIYSGHYHIKQSLNKNFHYLGNSYQKNRNDFGERKGIHILDVETKGVEFIENTTSPRFFNITVTKNPFDKDEVILKVNDGLDVDEEMTLKNYKKHLPDIINGQHITLLVSSDIKMVASIKALINNIQESYNIASIKFDYQKSMVEETEVDEADVQVNANKNVVDVIMNMLDDDDHKDLLLEIVGEVNTD